MEERGKVGGEGGGKRRGSGTEGRERRKDMLYQLNYFHLPITHWPHTFASFSVPVYFKVCHQEWAVGVHCPHVVLGYLSHQRMSSGVHFTHGCSVVGQVMEDGPTTLILGHQVTWMEDDYTVKGKTHIHGDVTVSDVSQLDEVPGKVPGLNEGIYQEAVCLFREEGHTSRLL